MNHAESAIVVLEQALLSLESIWDSFLPPPAAPPSAMTLAEQASFYAKSMPKDQAIVLDAVEGVGELLESLKGAEAVRCRALGIPSRHRLELKHCA